jgi:hypothetical protein
MPEPTNRPLDMRTATNDEIVEAMNRGVRKALREHKLAGNPIVVWDRDTNTILTVPPEEIPEYPEEPGEEQDRTTERE